MPLAFSNEWRIMAELLHGISSSTAGIVQEFRHNPIFSNGWRIYSWVLAEFGGIISVEAICHTVTYMRMKMTLPHLFDRSQGYFRRKLGSKRKNFIIIPCIKYIISDRISDTWREKAVWSCSLLLQWFHSSALYFPIIPHVWLLF